MELILVTIAGFVAAALAPAVSAKTQRAHWVLALVPFTLLLYFLAQIPDIRNGETTEVAYEWVPALGTQLAFRLDGISLLFAILISGIGTLVIIYAGAYLSGRPYLGRFLAILLVFMASMLGLVLADDLLLLFVFWELTSVSSYGLISIESHRAVSRAAALQALLITAGGGLALLAGLILINVATGTQTISEIAQIGPAALRSHGLYEAAMLLVLVGAFTKSAQFPFYFWLPNAMEAPTPVSAYLHSATMVKAGVYLLARFTPILGDSDLWFYLVTITGGLTMVLGAVLALRESDLKRILAYVTVSILGALVMLIGMGTEESILAAVVLLFAHALYKACLFLVAGIVDHEVGTREIDRLGGLARYMPVTAACALLAAASMAGLPLWIGFVAKELVYEALLHGPRLIAIGTVVGLLANVLMVVVAVLVGVRPFVGTSPAKSSSEPDPSQDHDGGHGGHLHDPGTGFLIGPVVLCAVGVVLGLIPDLAGSNLLVPAASSIVGEHIAVNLAVWHGVNFALVLSGLTVAAAVLVYYLRVRIRTLLLRASAILKPVSPEQIYLHAISGLFAVGLRQTRLLQNGYLRFYVSTVLVAALSLVSITLVTEGRLDIPQATSGIEAYEPLVAIVILGGAALAVSARTRLTAAIALGMVGYGVALVYILYGAPDLAMTQVLVETLIVLLLVFAFYRLPRFSVLSTAGTRLRDGFIALASGAMVTVLLLTSLSVPRDQTLSNLISESSKPLAHGSNIVNVILVDFRALDTLGEIVVLGVAAIGILALFRRWTSARDD